MHQVARAFAVVMLLSLLTACGDDTSTPATPAPSASASPTGTARPDAAMDTTAWFVRFDEQANFWVEPVPGATGAADTAERAAMDYLFGADPADPALFNFADRGEVRDVRRDGDVLVVDVSAAIDPPGQGRSSTEESAFAQQLAYTASQFDGVTAVRLLVEGEPIEDLWGHVDWSQPVEPAEFRETPITVDSPAWGAEVPRGPLTVHGEANTFEATLAVRLIDPSGQVVEDQWITATSGSGTRGTWRHTFDTPLDEAGMWVVEAEEPDPSGGAEGRRPLVVRVEFTVP